MDNLPGDWPLFPVGTPVGANLYENPAVLGQVFAQAGVSQGIRQGCATAKCLTAVLCDPQGPLFGGWHSGVCPAGGHPGVPSVGGCARARCWLSLLALAWSCCLKPIIICVILTAEGTDLQSFFLVRHNHQPDLSCLAEMHTQ